LKNYILIRGRTLRTTLMSKEFVQLYRVIFRVEADLLSNMHIATAQDYKQHTHPVLKQTNPSQRLYLISARLDDFSRVVGPKKKIVTVKNKLCLCLLSRYPLFALHQQILVQISSKKMGLLNQLERIKEWRMDHYLELEDENVKYEVARDTENLSQVKLLLIV